VAITLWEAQGVTLVPVSALFRDGEGWAVFAVEAGRARKKKVDLGHRSAEAAEVLAGLAAGEQVIAYPVDTLKDGALVVAR
jgi:HlyD family secretion protein